MASPLHTRLCELLGVRLPVIQTGMGWVATPELTAAVSEAGGFGFLAAATLRPEEVGPAIERTRSLTERPFGVNFLMDAPGAETVVDALIEHGVRAAGYNRAPRPDLISRLKGAGVLCIPTCGAVRHAVKAEKLGADAIVVQGAEGGGHTGSVPTTLLLSKTVDAVGVPVVAAGGFHDGRGLVAALAWGAAGVAMGTRFLLTRESPVPEQTLGRYLAAGVEDIVVTREVDGLPQRVVRNELVERLEAAGSATRLLLAFRHALAFRRLSGASLPELLRAAFALRRNQRLSRAQMLMAAGAPVLARKAMIEGDPVRGYLPSGSVAGILEDRPSCAELLARIEREALATLAGLCAGGGGAGEAA